MLNQSLRKLIGTIALILFLIVYVFLAMSIGVSRLIPENHLIEAIYYLVAGIVWIFPIRYLIGWMQKPDAPH